MVVVVDANIFIKSIIRINGPITSLLLKNAKSIDFAAPDFVLQEILSKELKICKQQKITSKEFHKNLAILKGAVLFLKDDMLSEQEFKKAYNIIHSIDADDTIYLAFAIALGGILWTEDRKLHNHLRRKKLFYSASTTELKQIIKGL